MRSSLQSKADGTSLIYIDRHLVHEVPPAAPQGCVMYREKTLAHDMNPTKADLNSWNLPLFWNDVGRI